MRDKVKAEVDDLSVFLEDKHLLLGDTQQVCHFVLLSLKLQCVINNLVLKFLKLLLLITA
jgi:hypothetical protein